MIGHFTDALSGLTLHLNKNVPIQDTQPLPSARMAPGPCLMVHIAEPNRVCISSYILVRPFLVQSGVQAGLIYLYYLPMSYMMSRVSKRKDVHRAIPGLKIQQCCNLLGFNSNTIQVQ